MCILSTVTLIVEKNILYNILFHVLIFQSNDDSVINEGRIIHTGTVHVCTYSANYNESVLCLFVFMVKRENNAVPEFFKMFSIVQMMFNKEFNLIE